MQQLLNIRANYLANKKYLKINFESVFFHMHHQTKMYLKFVLNKCFGGIFQVIWHIDMRSMCHNNDLHYFPTFIQDYILSIDVHHKICTHMFKDIRSYPCVRRMFSITFSGLNLWFDLKHLPLFMGIKVLPFLSFSYSIRLREFK